MIHSTVGRLQKVLDLSLPMIDCQSLKPCNKWVNKFACEALHSGKSLRRSTEAYKKQLVRSARGKANLTGLVGCVGGKVQTPKILLETLPNSFPHAVSKSLGMMVNRQNGNITFCIIVEVSTPLIAIVPTLLSQGKYMVHSCIYYCTFVDST